MSPAAAICLITPGHLASTPRIVKFADALASAGQRVHVVAGRHYLPAEPLDAAILADARWTCTRVPFHRGLSGSLRRIARHLARRCLVWRLTARQLATRAQHVGISALATTAARQHADFYFGGGGVAGLAAAASAARQTGVDYGFDAEDWHEEESTFVQQDAAERTAVRSLLGTWLPGARVVTCAAPLIGEAYATAYGIAPVCVLNVFPLSEAPAALVDVPPPSPAQPAVLYWFSQTIGPGRGLEGMIDVIARLRTPAVLHLRGFVSDDYRAELTARAAARQTRPPVFLPAAPAAEMVRLAATAHLGLSLEQSEPRNRDLCLTNKVFTYLLAGVPVALTPTRAQSALMPSLGEAALPVDLTNPATTAARLDAWLPSAESRSAAAAAWRQGQEIYNWDREQHRLLASLAQTLPSRS